MNTTTTITTHSNFIALDVSYRLIEALSVIAPVIERNDRGLADQIRRAATSVSLNLAEGQCSMKATGGSTMRSRMAARTK